MSWVEWLKGDVLLRYFGSGDSVRIGLVIAISEPNNCYEHGDGYIDPHVATPLVRMT